MITRFRDAFLWAQALDRYARKDFRHAVAKLEAIRGARSKASEYLALLGTAYIALGMPEGRSLLIRAISDSSPTRKEYKPYVKAYCDYYLSILDGNKGAEIKHIETALHIYAPKIIRRWLPLS